MDASNSDRRTRIIAGIAAFVIVVGSIGANILASMSAESDSAALTWAARAVTALVGLSFVAVVLWLSSSYQRERNKRRHK